MLTPNSPEPRVDLARRFGQELHDLRRRAHLTPERMATLVDYKLRSISHIESGLHVPRWDIVECYLREAHVPDHRHGEYQMLWEKARAQQRQKRNAVRQRQARKKHTVYTCCQAQYSPVVLLIKRTAGFWSPGTISVAECWYCDKVTAHRCSPASVPVELSPGDIALWPNPGQIASWEDLSRALLQIKQHMGLSYKAIADRSQLLGGTTLSHGLAHKLCTAGQAPRRSAYVATFVRACGGSAALARQWWDTCVRLRGFRGQEYTEEL
ncbi:helix-turn-helix domain-containing protein [Streptoalloteichus hindustanus]|uniref:Helix-turn-helix domain-containing protein n=1 Tax=Streptoalloteichus hindustanus TaxID=2017 RepID=A0A1M5G8E4_STRHI|nr:helix-turn-helix transcriptional regulator [Streptoalloteichus hindustanus]SHF99999.1 Helix-turn-helix domain-containing protein [Streptoalloteichus hindustanus]